MRRKSNVSTQWTSDLAYAIGLITSDGNLSPDGRHINLTSKDEEIITVFRNTLCLHNKIGRKSRGHLKEKRYFVIQFGDINFYEFLTGLGLHPAKSKTLGPLKIPADHFADFLRGCVDGDGNIDTYKHPESRFIQFRLRLSSASPVFLLWIKEMCAKLANTSGGFVYTQKGKSVSTLCFSKSDAVKLVKFMYHNPASPALKRKRVLASKAIRASGGIGIHATLRT